MADFSETISSLEGTQGFFKSETKEYKQFRDSLKELNKMMDKCGNRAVTAKEVTDLRMLAGKTKMFYEAYMEKVTGV